MVELKPSKLKTGVRFPLSAPNNRPDGGIGRRAGLKIRIRKECGFDSHSGHQNAKPVDQAPKAGIVRSSTALGAVGVLPPSTGGVMAGSR